MKKLFKISMMAGLLVCSQFGNAQSILDVVPGYGTLNSAISANGGTKIYRLKAGEWYGLNAPIENVDYHLQIIGAEPDVTGGMPATLQTGTSVNGAAFEAMFTAKGNLTIKNIYIVNADLSAQTGANCIYESKDNARVVVDRCILHPASGGMAIAVSGKNTKVYFTNNQAINNGHMLNPNCGHFFNFIHPTIGFDSLLVENNTFVCMGTTMLNAGLGTPVINNVLLFNHNTIIMNKSQLDWTTRKNEEYWTNNLFFDVNTQPWASSWQPMPGADLSMPKPNLIYAAPLDNEVLPSVRPNFVEYNSLYRAQGFYDLITELNIFSRSHSLPLLYLFPLVWPKDSTNCREAQMFNSDNFPKFKYGNTIIDVDPQWVDNKIYDHEANFVKWTKPASYVHALGQPSTNYPPASAWAQYWWIPSGDLSNNSVWPVFNGRYTNSATLTGSIENLPLGDLNWFPTQKAFWLANKASITSHIKMGNTNKWTATGVVEVKTNGFTVYPNPANGIVTVKGVTNADIKILGLDGRMLLNAKNVTKIDVSTILSGSYLISIKEGNKVSTQKLEVVR
ncbi:MAG: T9SS type A sorting domain-containing protein [Paludibacter sp.]|nr:T9SS type A sorting domain-containing protein [Paludibacter sp.]